MPTPSRSATSTFTSGCAQGFLEVAKADPHRCQVIDGRRDRPKRDRRRDLGPAPSSRSRHPREEALMARPRRPPSNEAEALPEADRLGEFPHPRDTHTPRRPRRGRAHAGRGLRRRAPASRLAAGRSRRHRQGDAGLPHGTPRAGPARRSATRRAGVPGGAGRVGGGAADRPAGASGAPGAAPALRAEVEAPAFGHPRGRGAPPALVPGPHGGRRAGAW